MQIATATNTLSFETPFETEFQKIRKSIQSEIKNTINAYKEKHQDEELDLNHFAAFFITDIKDSNFFQLLSIGTGSKCISPESMLKSKPGEAVLDTHAVPVARRALLLYLYQNVKCLLENSDDKREYLLELVENEVGVKQFQKKSNYQLNLFMNLACGDAEEYKYEHVSKNEI